MSTPTITEFLEARISEDEALAEAASVSMHGQHHAESWDYASYVLGSERDATEAQDRFITEWWPSRVLAECAAKRAVVTSYRSCVGAEGRVEVTKEFEVKLVAGGMVKGLELAVKHLAAVYSSHEDYDSGWAL